MDNVNTRVRDLRQKKTDIAAQKTYEKDFKTEMNYSYYLIEI